VTRQQVVLDHPIKALGVYQLRVVLHPEVSIAVSVNIARSREEAERQRRGEATVPVEEEPVDIETMLDQAAGEDLA